MCVGVRAWVRGCPVCVSRRLCLGASELDCVLMTRGLLLLPAALECAIVVALRTASAEREPSRPAGRAIQTPSASRGGTLERKVRRGYQFTAGALRLLARHTRALMRARKRGAPAGLPAFHSVLAAACARSTVFRLHNKSKSRVRATNNRASAERTGVRVREKGWIDRVQTDCLLVSAEASDRYSVCMCPRSRRKRIARIQQQVCTTCTPLALS